MKKLMTLALTGAFAAMAATTFTACDKGGDDNGGRSVPDPEGTMTTNISGDSSWIYLDLIFTGDYCPKYDDYHEYGGYGYNHLYLGWGKPDNIFVNAYLYHSTYDGLFYVYSFDCEMADVGAVAGLGNVRKVPDAGWGNNFACEQGHGYLIRIKVRSRYKTGNFSNNVAITASDPDYWEGTQYARMYVAEPIVSTAGGVMGAKVKVQYPFEP